MLYFVHTVMPTFDNFSFMKRRIAVKILHDHLLQTYLARLGFELSTSGSASGYTTDCLYRTVILKYQLGLPQGVIMESVITC